MGEKISQFLQNAARPFQKPKPEWNPDEFAARFGDKPIKNSTYTGYADDEPQVDKRAFTDEMRLLAAGLEHEETRDEALLYLIPLLEQYHWEANPLPPKLATIIVLALENELAYIETVLDDNNAEAIAKKISVLELLQATHRVAASLVENKLFAPRLKRIRNKTKALLQRSLTVMVDAFYHGKGTPYEISGIIAYYTNLFPEQSPLIFQKIKDSFLDHTGYYYFSSDSSMSSDRFKFLLRFLQVNGSPPAPSISELEIVKIRLFLREVLLEFLDQNIEHILDPAGNPLQYVRNVEFFNSFIPESEPSVSSKIMTDLIVKESSKVAQILSYWNKPNQIPNSYDHGFISPERGIDFLHKVIDGFYPNDALTYLVKLMDEVTGVVDVGGISHLVDDCLRHKANEFMASWFNGNLPLLIESLKFVSRVAKRTGDKELEKVYVDQITANVRTIEPNQLIPLLESMHTLFGEEKYAELLTAAVQHTLPHQIRSRNLQPEFFDLIEFLQHGLKVVPPKDIVTETITDALLDASEEYIQHFLHILTDREFAQRRIQNG